MLLLLLLVLLFFFCLCFIFNQNNVVIALLRRLINVTYIKKRKTARTFSSSKTKKSTWTNERVLSKYCIYFYVVNFFNDFVLLLYFFSPYFNFFRRKCTCVSVCVCVCVGLYVWMWVWLNLFWYTWDDLVFLLVKCMQFLNEKRSNLMFIFP